MLFEAQPETEGSSLPTCLVSTPRFRCTLAVRHARGFSLRIVRRWPLLFTFTGTCLGPTGKG